VQRPAPKGKIFGSVNAIQIAEALQEKGFTIDRKTFPLKRTSSRKLAPIMPG
jgi:ribosomal protein L9